MHRYACRMSIRPKPKPRSSLPSAEEIHRLRLEMAQRQQGPPPGTTIPQGGPVLAGGVQIGEPQVITPPGLPPGAVLPPNPQLQALGAGQRANPPGGWQAMQNGMARAGTAAASAQGATGMRFGPGDSADNGMLEDRRPVDPTVDVGAPAVAERPAPKAPAANLAAIKELLRRTREAAKGGKKK